MKHFAIHHIHILYKGEVYTIQHYGAVLTLKSLKEIVKSIEKERIKNGNEKI